MHLKKLGGDREKKGPGEQVKLFVYTFKRGEERGRETKGEGGEKAKKLSPFIKQRTGYEIKVLTILS